MPNVSNWVRFEAMCTGKDGLSTSAYVLCYLDTDVKQEITHLGYQIKSNLKS